METLVFMGKGQRPTVILVAESPSEGKKIYNQWLKTKGYPAADDVLVARVDPGQLVCVDPDSLCGLVFSSAPVQVKSIPLQHKPDITLTPL